MVKACNWTTTMLRRFQRKFRSLWRPSTHLLKLYDSCTDRGSIITDTISIFSTFRMITCMNVFSRERLPCDRRVRLNSNMPVRLTSCRCHSSVRPSLLHLRSLTLFFASLQYKLDLSRDDLQHWHKPSLQFPTGIPLRFEKLVSTGRTKQQREAIKAMQRQGKKIEVEVPKTSKDLSMSDRAPFALFEYSVR